MRIPGPRGLKCHTLYTIRYEQSDSQEVKVEWFTTFNAALRRLRKLKLQDEIVIRESEVPKSKVHLCSFLNDLFGTV